MAQITINEISQNYSYSIGTNSFATVAMPITSCWGPGFFDPATFVPEGVDEENAAEYMLEHTAWQRFPATQAGLEAFVAAYRGPAANYRLAKDYSYQMAMTLLTAGYDVLVCRLCPGSTAQGTMTQDDGDSDGASSGPTITFTAKYPGTFGNSLQIGIKKLSYFDKFTGEIKFYWNIVTYVIDQSGIKSAVESLNLVFNSVNSSDTILYWKEIESNFWTIAVDGTVVEDNSSATPTGADGNTFIRLAGGTDYDTETVPDGDAFKNIIKGRYDWATDYVLGTYTSEYPDWVAGKVGDLDDDTKKILFYKEWVLTNLVGTNKTSGDEYVGGVFDILKDKLAYNPNRLISPGWDDQDYFMYTDDVAELPKDIANLNDPTCEVPVSPLHLKIMDVAYYSRCATGLIDVPHVVDRKYVHIEDESNPNRQGYIQKLARITPKNAALDTNASLYHTHSAFFAPWGQFTYVGTGRMNEASPSFLALMIQRAQILNQALQYEWALPTNRKHSLKIGKLEYTVPKKLLDKWQKLDGVSVNIITPIPDLGTNLWGNSTLYEVPPATYQALANLSTRYLVNAVEDTAYRVGIGITFQYNNGQAYNKFYAGVTPLLDTMKNVGAIDDYYVRMSADISEEGQVNANTVLGKIYLVINGVINDIIVDLVCLPPGTDLNAFRA